MPFLEIINVLDLVSLYKAKNKKMHVHQVQDRCFLYVQMMKINCDTAQEYYLQQAIKDKMQGFSFSHPKCSATVLLQLAVELQHLKEEFYNVGKWTMFCTLAFYIVKFFYILVIERFLIVQWLWLFKAEHDACFEWIVYCISKVEYYLLNL